MTTIEEDLQILDAKIKQLRLDYEQYFLGARPREPVQLRGEVQKLIALYSNVPIQNTAQRFKFSSLCSRYLILRRQWDLALRKIEDGTYERHVFKANLHARPARESTPAPAEPTPPAAGEDLFDAYVAACRSVGQETAGLVARSLCFATASSDASAAEKKSESGGLPRLSAAEAGFSARSLCFATASSDASSASPGASPVTP